MALNYRATQVVTRLQQRRSFIIPSVLGAAVSHFFYGEEARLADAMAAGKLHRKKSSFELEQEKTARNYIPQRPEPNYPGHVPLNDFERAFLIVGSSIGAFLTPQRNEFIVGLGESTAFPWFLNNLRRQMLNDPVGRQILEERPRMTSDSLDLEKLRAMPPNSLGNSYVQWLDREGVSPDTREPVRFVDDEELAYVFQRYRECHDFYHTITGLPIVREGEIALKCFEFLNLGIPMTGLGALFAPWNTSRKQRSRLFNIYYPWALRNASSCKPLINVYWENIMEKDIDALRTDLGLTKPPDMRELRKKAKALSSSKHK